MKFQMMGCDRRIFKLKQFRYATDQTKTVFGRQQLCLHVGDPKNEINVKRAYEPCLDAIIIK